MAKLPKLEIKVTDTEQFKLILKQFESLIVSSRKVLEDYNNGYLIYDGSTTGYAMDELSNSLAKIKQEYEEKKDGKI